MTTLDNVKFTHHEVDIMARRAYGVVVTLALIVSLEHTTSDPLTVIFTLVGSLLVIAIAEIYVKHAALIVKERQRLGGETIAHLVREELGIMLAAEAPVALFVLALCGLVSLETAFWYSKIASLLFLFFFGSLLGSVFHRKWYRRMFTGLLYMLLGVGIMLLKLLFK